jgi:hypothetical protein
MRKQPGRNRRGSRDAEGGVPYDGKQIKEVLFS